jgi:hypothetical protein
MAYKHVLKMVNNSVNKAVVSSEAQTKFASKEKGYLTKIEDLEKR